MNKEPVIFNKSLDREPLLFSVLPPNLLIPMSLFFGFDAFVFLLWLKVSWIFVVVAFAVENIIWIILTARGTHTFLSRFESPPYWINTCKRFKPILPLEYIDFQIEEQVMQPIQNGKNNTSVSMKVHESNDNIHQEKGTSQ